MPFNSTAINRMWAVVTTLGLGFAITASMAIAQAEGELSTEQLLFEPRPIPEAEAPEPDFVVAPTPPTDTLAKEEADTAARQVELDGLLALVESSGTPQERTERLLRMGSLYLALGKHRQADEMQNRVLELITTEYGPDSPEAAGALQNLGEWNIRAFLDRSSISLSIPRLNVTNYLVNGLRSPKDLSEAANQTDNPLQNLYHAKGNFLNALTILTRNDDFANPALYELERRFQTVLFLSTQRENIIYEPDFYLTRRASQTGSRLNLRTQNLNDSPDYDDGVTSFQRVLAYVGSNRARTPAQIINTLLEEADWDLLYARPDLAEEKYDSAFQYFERTPVLLEQGSQFIYPEVPVVLPTFLPAPNSRERLGIEPDQPVNYVGYFDVSYSINKSGRTNDVEVLGQGGGVNAQMELRLKTYLAKVFFRPRYKAGKLDTTPMRLRYYVAY